MIYLLEMKACIDTDLLNNNGRISTKFRNSSEQIVVLKTSETYLFQAVEAKNHMVFNKYNG